MTQQTKILARLKRYQELEDIVSAMKNLAQVELHRLNQVETIQRDAYFHTLNSMAILTHFHPAITQVAGSEPQTLIIMGSERGFCGGFNERIARYVQQQSVEGQVLVIGNRLSSKLNASPQTVFFQAPTSTDELLDCANRIQDYFEREARPKRLRVLNHGADGITSKPLLPHPELPVTAKPNSLLTPVAPEKLWQQIQNLCLQQGLLYHLMQSLKIENQLRLQQMEGAREHLEELTKLLQMQLNSLRQQEITEEIEVILGGRMELL